MEVNKWSMKWFRYLILSVTESPLRQFLWWESDHFLCTYPPLPAAVGHFEAQVIALVSRLDLRNACGRTLPVIIARLPHPMADISSCPPLIRQSVLEAHERIKTHVHRTPVLTSSTLDGFASSALGHPCKLYFKCENYQRIGAFKARGAFHAISRLRDDELKNGVVTHSSGRRLCITPYFCLPIGNHKTTSDDADCSLPRQEIMLLHWLSQRALAV